MKTRGPSFSRRFPPRREGDTAGAGKPGHREPQQCWRAAEPAVNQPPWAARLPRAVCPLPGAAGGRRGTRERLDFRCCGHHPRPYRLSSPPPCSPYRFSSGNPAPASSPDRPSLAEGIDLVLSCLLGPLPPPPTPQCLPHSLLSLRPVPSSLTCLPLRSSQAEHSGVIDELGSSGWQAGGQPARAMALTR